MEDHPICSGDRRIWLASASPRRRELLSQVGLEPLVRTSGVEEVPEAGECAGEYTLRLSRAKGEDVRGGLTPEDVAQGPGWLLAADTIVVHGGRILEKPQGREHAMEILGSLSGQEHEVLTAFWVGAVRGDASVHELVSTRVRFRVMGVEEIARYVDTGEPMDKAGAYGIQGIAGAFVERIEGSYANVVGLPVGRVISALLSLGALEGFSFVVRGLGDV